MNPRDILHDFSLALRTLARKPLYSGLVVIPLALGIGASAAVFKLIDAVLLQPIAAGNVERLVVAQYFRQGETTPEGFAYRAFRAFREEQEAFEDTAVYAPIRLGLSRGDTSALVNGELVSENYFSVLGVQAALGRTFADNERDHKLAVLSDRTWRRHFGADPAVLGAQLLLNDEPFEIIGVAPRSFRGMHLAQHPEIWIPIETQPSVATGIMALIPVLEATSVRWLDLVIRLRPDWTIDRCETTLDAANLRFHETHSESPSRPRVALLPARSAAAGNETRADLDRFLAFLAILVGFELLIACSNAAALLIARHGERGREAAVRLALGAGRIRFGFQLLAESIWLCLFAATLGLVLASSALTMLKRFELPGTIPLGTLDLHLDSRMLLFTFTLAAATALATGLPVVAMLLRGRLSDALRQRASGQAPGHAVFRHGLVVAQTTLSLLLLIGAGLFLRTVRSTMATDPGFTFKHVAQLSVDLGLRGYDEARARGFFDASLEQVAALPAVTTASWAHSVPVEGGSIRAGVVVRDYRPKPDENLEIDMNVVGPGYFETLGIQLVQGRVFQPQDDPRASATVIVNENFAERFWPGRDPIGRRLSISGAEGEDLLVVGVVKTSKYHSLREATIPYLYVPLAQRFDLAGLSRIYLVARVHGSPSDALAGLRGVLRELDPTLPTFAAMPLEEALRDQLLPQRMGAVVLGLLSVLAVGLVMAGVFGLLDSFVRHRRHEIGLRMALGAQRGQLVRLVIFRLAVLVASGLVIGVLAAQWLMRIIGTLLHGVGAFDLATIATAAIVLATFASLASIIPLARALRISPAAALRDE